MYQVLPAPNEAPSDKPVGLAASDHRAGSTVSERPRALVIATIVEKRGLPFGERARYRLSRSMRAFFATYATP
jgi:hypothetical protein